MLKRIVFFVLLLPIGVALIVLSVANRQQVTLRLDPFNAEQPALAVSLPFFAYLFAALICGIVIGGIVMWWRQGRHRREARRQRAEAQRWRQLAEDHRRHAAAASLPVPANDRAA